METSEESHRASERLIPVLYKRVHTKHAVTNITSGGDAACL